MFIIQTERVGLRKFDDCDLKEFAALNSDPEVMTYFPKVLNVEECQQFIIRVNNKIDEQGFGFWAAEHLKSSRLMGFVGLTCVTYETEFTPAVEIGWRLAKEYWGRGLATEAARASLDFAFDTLALEEVVSFTSVLNQRSFKVMERIGMKKVGEFDHPKIESGHRLRRHVLYNITRSEHVKLRR